VRQYQQLCIRVGTPEDLAVVATFLASDAARWVTGQNVQAAEGSFKVTRAYGEKKQAADLKIREVQLKLDKAHI